MKKHLFISLLMVLFVGTTMHAYDFMVDGICYNINGTEATVTYGGGYSDDITIPATVTYNDTTYSVTSIGDYAFYKCAGLTSVAIPNSVTSIGSQAFYICRNLTSVTIGNSVTSIGSYAFYWCSALTSVNIPNSVTIIDTSAFDGCSSLTSVDIGNSVTEIGTQAFYNCSGLTSVTIHDLDAWCKISFGGRQANPLCNAHHLFIDGEEITDLVIPNTVTSIGSNAFSGCSGLTSVTIPNSVTTIGGSAFEDCSGLTSVTIPNSVTTIGWGAFYYCSSLTSVTVENGNPKYDSRNNCNAIIETATNILVIGCKATVIPNSVTSIGPGAFMGCSGLISIDIPNSVTSIGAGAFEDCTALTSITIPNSVTSITGSMLCGCSSLTSVEIPDSVTTIYNYAFEGCSALTSIDIPNTVTSLGYSVFAGCSGLTSVTIHDLDAWCRISFADSKANPLYNAHHLFIDGEEIIDLVIPNSVTSIKRYAFYGCSSLTRVEIPNTVSSIGNSAFEGCSSLTSVTIGNSVTSIGSQAFSGCSSLNDVFSMVDDPTTITMGSDVFYRSPGNYAARTLHVPVGTVSAYQADTNWSKYFGLIVEMEHDVTISGDVNGDGQVNITDVTMLIDYVLTGNSGGISLDAADCSQDGNVNITDVTVLIGFVLNGTWPD